MSNEMNGEPPVLTHQEVTDAIAMEQRMADYTIKTQAAEIERLQTDVQYWKDEARRRSELGTHNMGLLQNEIDRLRGELSQIENIVKEALKQDA